MPATVKYKLVVLFVDEVRNAARALEQVTKLTKDTPDDEFSEAVMMALNTCLVALHGADDESATVLLGAKPLVKD